MSKQKFVEIIISNSDDCIFHGAKLAEVLSKYRWVEYAFNTCHYDAERNEVFLIFQNQLDIQLYSPISLIATISMKMVQHGKKDFLKFMIAMN